jgi:acyl-CoA synthetase (AMP-forming)/AMP-acid ligase II
MPGDMVATYLMNSADFVVIWMGLFCIGCAPAHLNYNLKGDALIHCLKIAGVKMVLVDEDAECRARFEECQERVSELGVRPYTVDEALLEKVFSGPLNVPGDEYRENVVGSDPTCLLYTSGTTGLPKARSLVLLHADIPWHGRVGGHDVSDQRDECGSRA